MLPLSWTFSLSLAAEQPCDLEQLTLHSTSKKAALLQGAAYVVSKEPASKEGVPRGREGLGPHQGVSGVARGVCVCTCRSCRADCVLEVGGHKFSCTEKKQTWRDEDRSSDP